MPNNTLQLFSGPAVGNDTTVANGAEPPALDDPGAFPPRSRTRAGFSALRARIPHVIGLHKHPRPVARDSEPF